MTIEDLIQKGLIKTCDKHGVELVYFDATQECPVCKVVIQSKPINKKKLPQPVPVPAKEPPKQHLEDLGLIDKVKAFLADPKNNKKKIVIAVILLVLLWVYMNCQNLVSYLH
jgi:hypothetical protein